MESGLALCHKCSYQNHNQKTGWDSKVSVCFDCTKSLGFCYTLMRCHLKEELVLFSLKNMKIWRYLQKISSTMGQTTSEWTSGGWILNLHFVLFSCFVLLCFVFLPFCLLLAWLSLGWNSVFRKVGCADELQFTCRWTSEWAKHAQPQTYLIFQKFIDNSLYYCQVSGKVLRIDMLCLQRLKGFTRWL